jgi:hypothetical protein
MAGFDFITNREFRESLESDYAEMHRCAEVKAWKSVQVLAGSVVEALLIDYLAAIPSSTRSLKDPLKADLAEAISVCLAEKVISQRTADLCSVIRSYRNLIHPGRVVRLEEVLPSPQSAQVALASVDLITEEIARKRNTALGPTAEQLLSKLQRDENALIILKHLLNDATEAERERLLVDLIPKSYLHLTQSHDAFTEEVGSRLVRAYRLILSTVSVDARKRTAQEFVRVLREGDGAMVHTYTEVFFKPEDLADVPVDRQPMVREHLLGRVPRVHSEKTLKYVQGIGPHLATGDVQKWLDPFVRTFISNTVSEEVKKKARECLLDATASTSSEVDKAIDKRLNTWIKHFDVSGSEEKVAVLRDVKEDIDWLREPL